jgi:purine-binding chemotaxis protein CheW
MATNAASRLENATATNVAEQTQYLTFVLDKETFAIGILAIKEIIEYHDLTTVPMMPVIGKRTCVVIVEVNSGESQVIGVIVDAVNQVLEIPASDIEPPPPFGARIRSDFIYGMGKVDGKFVILLDVAHVLSVDELGMLADASAAVASSP